MKQRDLCPEAGCHLLERGRACTVLAAVAQGKSSMNISNPGPRGPDRMSEGGRKEEQKGKGGRKAGWWMRASRKEGWLAAGAGLRKSLTLLVSDEEKDQPPAGRLTETLTGGGDLGRPFMLLQFAPRGNVVDSNIKSRVSLKVGRVNHC